MLSTIAAEHIHNPRYRGPIEAATVYGVEGSPGDGPYVQLWLVVEDGVILQAAFKTPGCPSSTASASMMCQLITGRTLEQAGQLTGQDLLVVLGGLPEGKEDHAFRSVKALADALAQQGEL